MEANTIYTVGYTAYDIEEFITELKKYNITHVIDVRSNPFSQYYSDYNKNNLENKLRQNGMLYQNYNIEFGARQSEKIYFSTNGYLDFSKFSKSEQFISGINKVLEGIEQNYVFALMCAEKEPINCHRSILVGREFHKIGIVVKHILSEGNILLHSELEQQLLERYFSNREQINLFSEVKSEEELIEEAYALSNAEIGYKEDSA